MGLFGGATAMVARARWLTASAAIALLGKALPGMALTPPERSLTKHLPADTALAVMIDTRPEAWTGLTQFELFRKLAAEYDRPIHPGLPYLPGSAETLTTWAGATAVVALPPGPAPGSPMTDAMVMLVPVLDGSGRDAYLTDLEQRLGAPERQTYRQTPLLYWAPAWESADLGPIQIQPTAARTGLIGLPKIPLPLPGQLDPSGVAIALLPEMLVAAANPAALKHFLDQRPDSTATLTDLPDFQRALDQPQVENALAAAYGDVGGLLSHGQGGFSGELALPFPPIPPFDLEAVRAAGIEGTFEALIYPQPEGLRLQSRFYLDALSALASPEPAPSSLLDQLPAATYVLASSYNLTGTWQVVASFLENFSEETRAGLDAARNFVQLATGLDLDRELLGWMDGEFALFAFPAETSPFTQALPEAYIALGAMVQTSDRPAAETALVGFRELAELFALPLTEDIVNGESTIDLGLPLAGPEPLSVLSYGWSQEDTLTFASGRGPMARLINPIPFDPLSQHSTFRSATAGFPQANNGYFYLNAGACLLLAYGLLDIQDDPGQSYEITDYLSTLRSLSATTAATDDFFQIDGLLGLAPREP
ncbi:hypothetical protein C7271_16740 [filamentous cyanobacterium CCP5]|nr:hypothetical protein C7271_16740 [filamentous cyanobacterium CCP5]